MNATTSTARIAVTIMPPILELSRWYSDLGLRETRAPVGAIF
jgi:hypothetical protein